MSVWIYYNQLSPEAQAKLMDEPQMKLPIAEDVPSLAGAHSPLHCRRLVDAMHAGIAPESAQRLTDRLWRMRANIHNDDVIVVPLPHTQEIAVGDITTAYQHEAVGRANIHSITVKWQKKLPMRIFGKHKDFFIPPAGTESIVEIENKAIREDIHTRIERSYNRFSKWRWVMGVAVIIKIIIISIHMLQGNGL